MMSGTASSAGLIKTKFSKPGVNHYLISRQRLYQKLDNALKRKLTMVTAPAGYGKTTAVLEWLEKCDLPAAWLSIDPDDNNPIVFWRYICAALDSIAAGISKDTEYVFSSQELLRANIQLCILIDRLSDLAADFWLILDDVHLTTNPVILDGLSYLISYLPPQMHLPYLLEAMEEAQAAHCPGALVPAMINIARIKRARGDMQGAFEALEECKKKLQSCNMTHWNYLINAFSSRLHIDTGNMAEVDKWLGSCKLGIYIEISRAREFELLVYARALLAKDCRNDAELLLKRLLAFTEGAARLHSTVEVLNLLAMTAYKMGEMSNAMNYVEKSLAIGVAVGYVRSYVDELRPIACLLNQYIRTKQKNHPNAEALTAYAKTLLSQTQDNLQIAAECSEIAVTGTKELLTVQEKKVLELLLEAYTSENNLYPE